MFASAVRARNPLIKFLGKRSWPTASSKPAVHPLAPKEVQASFDAFLTKFSTAAGASAASGGASAPAAGAIPLYKQSSKPADFEDWEAPAYLWQQREFSDAEIDAVMSGGATYITDGP